MGRHGRYFDWLVFIPALLLVLLGLVTLLSIERAFFYQQLLFLSGGLLLFWLFFKIDFSIYPYLDKIIYVGSTLFLLTAFLGPNVRGATRWLELGGFRMQPSEILKPLYLLAFSSFLYRYPPTKFKNVLYHTGFFIVPFLLIFKQPDLGNSIVYVSVWVSLLLVAGLPNWVFIAGFLVTGISAPLIYELLQYYQKLRLLTFMDPFLDPKGAGYNAIQSMIAIGSGQLFGRGFGRGTQSLLKFLPERHTDFIFASFTEEFGFVGGIVLLALFLVLLWRMLTSAHTKQVINTAFFFRMGTFVLFFTQIIINAGMNMGILPITGITLPFVSYGGSSLLSLWVTLGIFMSAANSQERNPTRL